MILIFLNLAILVFATLLCEYLWRTKKISGEFARKGMHIFGGLLIAFWPLYLSWQTIQILLLVSLVALVVMRYTGLIKSLFAIKRRTAGEVFVLLTIGLLSIFEPPSVLFVLVVLQVAIADGMAAIIGTKYGKSNSYKVLGYQKSVAGTLACFLFSLVIVTGVFVIGGLSGTVPVVALIFIPLAVAIVENIGIYGLDNTLIALTVGGLAKLFNFY